MWSERASAVIASVVAALAFLAWVGIGSTFGAFSGTTASGGNSGQQHDGPAPAPEAHLLMLGYLPLGELFVKVYRDNR